jgi:hypothetical protein
MRVRRARAALLKDKLRQSRITSFFTRNIDRATTAQTLPAERQTSDHPHARQTRTQSQIPTLQQPRLYHLFPGRPPGLEVPSTDNRSKSSA